MADFLLELRSEEIPARMQAKARNDLSRLFAECTGEAGLSTGAIEAFSTPRRLVLIVRDVAAATQARRTMALITCTRATSRNWPVSRKMAVLMPFRLNSSDTI